MLLVNKLILITGIVTCFTMIDFIYVLLMNKIILNKSFGIDGPLHPTNNSYLNGSISIRAAFELI